MLMALRAEDYDEFLDTWMTSYQLAYGEFYDFPENGLNAERFIFVVATLFLQLILANMLIAHMGEIYSSAAENSEIEDTREQLIWIRDLQIQAIWDSDKKLVYLHSIQDKYAKEKTVKTSAKRMKLMKQQLNEL